MMLTRPEGALAAVVSTLAVTLEARGSRDVKRLALALAPLPPAPRAPRLATGVLRRLGAQHRRRQAREPLARSRCDVPRELRRGVRPRAAARRGALRRLATSRATPRRAAGAVALGGGPGRAGVLGFYGVIAGGDLFEYRPLAPLVPWIAIAMVTAATRSARPTHTLALVLAAQVALSAYIPWRQWSLTTEGPATDTRRRWWCPSRPRRRPCRGRGRACGTGCNAGSSRATSTVGTPTTRAGTALLHRGLPAPASSPPTAAGAARRAGGQRGRRGRLEPPPPRRDRLPRALRLQVIARTPPAPSGERHMAHERTPPPGYLRAFRPYFVWTPGVGPASAPRGRAPLRRRGARWRATGGRRSRARADDALDHRARRSPRLDRRPAVGAHAPVTDGLPRSPSRAAWRSPSRCAWGSASRGPLPPSWDGHFYARLAAQLARGAGYAEPLAHGDVATAFWPPGLPSRCSVPSPWAPAPRSPR